jgi:hypothetical protein
LHPLFYTHRKNISFFELKRADADDVSVPATPARRSCGAPKESNAPHESLVTGAKRWPRKF